MRFCSACGQTLPPRIDLGIRLTSGQQRLVERVHRAGVEGILSTDLLDYMYGDDPNGGPETGKKALAVRICQLNKVLRKKGWCIRAPKGGMREPTPYRLVKL